MKINSAICALLLLFASVGVMPSPADAHHSFAMFDRSKIVKVEGVVARFEWTNPHVFIDVEASGAPVVRYKIESASINMLMRAGWKFDSLKAGDKVEISFNPLKSGQPGGLLLEVKLGVTILKG